jgi:hypothetical protein
MMKKMFHDLFFGDSSEEIKLILATLNHHFILDEFYIRLPACIGCEID